MLRGLYTATGARSTAWIDAQPGGNVELYFRRPGNCQSADCVIRLLFPFDRIIRFIILNLRFHLPYESLLWRLQLFKFKTSMRSYLIIPYNKLFFSFEQASLI